MRCKRWRRRSSGKLQRSGRRRLLSCVNFCTRPRIFITETTMISCWSSSDRAISIRRVLWKWYVNPSIIKCVWCFPTRYVILFYRKGTLYPLCANLVNWNCTATCNKNLKLFHSVFICNIWSIRIQKFDELEAQIIPSHSTEMPLLSACWPRHQKLPTCGVNFVPIHFDKEQCYVIGWLPTMIRPTWVFMWFACKSSLSNGLSMAI